MKRLYIILLLLLLAALACATPPEWPPTPTAEPTPTEDVTAPPSTETPTATETPVPTTVIPPSPTATEIPPSPTATIPPEQWTPTPIVPGPTEPPNLLTNGGFEPPYDPQVFDNLFIADGWTAFYCDTPYVPEPCPASEGGNLGRPEYNPALFSQYPDRVYSGEAAQRFFCFYRQCVAGVYQIFDTLPGMDCRGSAYVQSWSSPESSGDKSRLLTEDDRSNHTWRLRVSLDGSPFAFDSQNLVSRDFGFADGIYDKYAYIWFDFRSNASRTTLFIEASNLYPIQHNDYHIDNAAVHCWPPGERPAPPAPPPAEYPTAHYTVTVNVRGGPGTSYDALAVVKAGETVNILDVVEKNNEAQSVWIKIFDTPDTGPGWAALRYAGQCYAVVSDPTLPCADTSGVVGYSQSLDVAALNILHTSVAGQDLEAALIAQGMGLAFSFGDLGAVPCQHCYKAAYFSGPQRLGHGFHIRGMEVIWLFAPADYEYTALDYAGVIGHEVQHALDYLAGLPSGEERPRARQGCIVNNVSPCDLGGK